MTFTKYFYSATEEKEGRSQVQREEVRGGERHHPQVEEGERREERGGGGGVGYSAQSTRSSLYPRVSLQRILILCFLLIKNAVIKYFGL